MKSLEQLFEEEMRIPISLNDLASSKEHRKGIEAWGSGNLDAALMHFQAALRLDPTNTPALSAPFDLYMKHALEVYNARKKGITGRQCIYEASRLIKKAQQYANPRLRVDDSLRALMRVVDRDVRFRDALKGNPSYYLGFKAELTPEEVRRKMEENFKPKNVLHRLFDNVVYLDGNVDEESLKKADDKACKLTYSCKNKWIKDEISELRKTYEEVRSSPVGCYFGSETIGNSFEVARVEKVLRPFDFVSFIGESLDGFPSEYHGIGSRRDFPFFDHKKVKRVEGRRVKGEKQPRGRVYFKEDYEVLVGSRFQYAVKSSEGWSYGSSRYGFIHQTFNNDMVINYVHKLLVDGMSGRILLNTIEYVFLEEQTCSKGDSLVLKPNEVRSEMSDMKKGIRKSFPISLFLATCAQGVYTFLGGEGLIFPHLLGLGSALGAYFGCRNYAERSDCEIVKLHQEAFENWESQKHISC